MVLEVVVRGPLRRAQTVLAGCSAGTTLPARFKWSPSKRSGTYYSLQIRIYLHAIALKLITLLKGHGGLLL